MATSSHSVLHQRPKAPSFGTPDAVLAALVISVVGLMIIPLPTWFLDLLIAGNLAVALTVLLVTLYVTDALKIAAFPSLLLVTTLLRLALNVSSTRLILLQADAGDMIRAFGNFVVSGNYVVGGVIFLILSIIQFVVIAKGSERVAEVGARFTLDAMPGKQMAIDAEQRAGGIDGQEAKRQRRQLARESQFYGAMDGAMKFVKGDVIASFLITLVNLIGGLAIGVLQKDMEAAAALKRYGLLTIGDGLVTQISSLVLAIAAGILVTRVASEEQDQALGQELLGQFGRAPKALSVAGGFTCVLGLVPGLPALPLLAIGGALLVAARRKPAPTPEVPGLITAQPVEAERRSGGPKFVPVVVPWSLELSSDLAEFSDDQMRGEELVRPGLRSVGNALREVLFRSLGVPLPPCWFQINSQLPSRTAVLSFHEVPAAVIELPAELPDQQLAQHLMDRCLPLLRSRSADFLGMAETQLLLDRLEHVAPATVRNVTPKPVGLGLLAEVLRRLSEEQVSIRDLKAILEALAQVAVTDKDPLNLTEYVRSQLRRQLTHSLTGGASQLEVIQLSADIEETIRDSINRTSAGAFLTLAPVAGRDIVASVRRALHQAGEQTQASVVLLTQPDTRRFVRKLCEADLPTLQVVAYSELLPELSVHSCATATLRGLPGS